VWVPGAEVGLGTEGEGAPGAGEATGVEIWQAQTHPAKAQDLTGLQSGFGDSLALDERAIG